MIKKLLLITLLTPIIAVAGPIQTDPPAPPSPIESFIGTLFAAKSASFVVYPSYGPDINVGGTKSPWGFGAAVLYPLSEYAFGGIRVDFLGDSFWAPSAVVGAKYTLKQLPFKPTVFTNAGLIMAVAGGGDQNHVVGATTGLGASAELWKSEDGRFSAHAFISGEKWSNYDGAVMHAGIGGAIKF